MDIKAQMNTGEWIDIEMQIEQLAAYANRSMFYGAKLVSEQLESGQSYDIIKPSIVISIVCGTLFPNIEKAHTIFRYKERELNFELTDKSELHFFELGKIDTTKPVREMTPLERFGAYIRYTASPERKEYIQELLSYGGEVIWMTDKMLKQISQDDQMREWQRARDLFLLDQQSKIWEAAHRGIEEGMAKGMAKGIEKGIEKGIVKGREEGFLNAKADEIRLIRRKLEGGMTVAELASWMELEEGYVCQIGKLGESYPQETDRRLTGRLQNGILKSETKSNLRKWMTT